MNHDPWSHISWDQTHLTWQDYISAEIRHTSHDKTAHHTSYPPLQSLYHVLSVFIFNEHREAKGLIKPWGIGNQVTKHNCNSSQTPWLSMGLIKHDFPLSNTSGYITPPGKPVGLLWSWIEPFGCWGFCLNCEWITWLVWRLHRHLSAKLTMYLVLI